MLLNRSVVVLNHQRYVPFSIEHMLVLAILSSAVDVPITRCNAPVEKRAATAAAKKACGGAGAKLDGCDDLISPAGRKRVEKLLGKLCDCSEPCSRSGGQPWAPVHTVCRTGGAGQSIFLGAFHQGSPAVGVHVNGSAHFLGRWPQCENVGRSGAGLLVQGSRPGWRSSRCSHAVSPTQRIR